MTQALADLIRRLWTNQAENPLRAVAPRPFKRALGQFRPQFQGYDQQDAHEFLLTVLSAVHEDTNRCDPEVDKNKNNKDSSSSNKRSKSKSKSAKVKVTDSNKVDAVNEESKGGSIVAPPDIKSTIECDDATSRGTTVGVATTSVGAAGLGDGDTSGEKKNEVDAAGRAEEKRSEAGRGRSRSNSVTLDLALASMDAWSKHKEKSHSIIVDLFHGQSCRSNICEECGHRISRFEPFPCLSINLRVQFAHKISVVRLPPVRPPQVPVSASVPASASDTSAQEARQKDADARYAAALKSFQCVLQFGVLTPQVGLIGDLKLALAEKCGIRSDRLSIAAGDRENLQFMGDHNQLRTVGEDQTLVAFELPTGFQDIAGHPIAEDPGTKQKNRMDSGSVGRGESSLAVSKSHPTMDGREKKRFGLCPCPCRQPVHVDPRGSECYDENGTFIPRMNDEGGDMERESEDDVDEGGDNDDDDEEEEEDNNAGRGRRSRKKNKKKKRKNTVRFVLDERVDACDFEGNWYPGTIVEVQLEQEGQERENEDDREPGQDVQRRRLQAKLDGASAGVTNNRTTTTTTATNENQAGRVLVNFDGFASRFNEWFDIGEQRRLLAVYTRTVQPPQKLNAALLLHRVCKIAGTVRGKGDLATAVGTSGATGAAGAPGAPGAAAMANDDGDGNRFFGTPRQIWFGSRLSSSDVHGIVASHIGHLIKDNVVGKYPPYKLLILKRRNDGTYGKPRPVMKTAAPPVLKKNEILVAEWDSPDSFNYELDIVQADESVAEALGQRGSEQKRSDERLTLEHCLGEYGNVETLSEDYKCDKCKAKGTTKTKVDIWRLPDILVIHMKRFVYTMYVRGKLNNLVHYPIRGLDMRPFLSEEARDAMAEMKLAKEASGEASGAPATVGGGGGEGGDGDAPLDDTYDLYAAVHHVGTMNGGHYVSTCRVEGDSDNWYQFNDRTVTPIDEEQIVSPTGYILFYKRRELSSANVINLSL